MILMRIFVLFSITCGGVGEDEGGQTRSWMTDLVLRSVGWWVRGWIEFEIRVEELESETERG
jgi:hypothetical protein